jgi:hypothetical protein
MINRRPDQLLQGVTDEIRASFFVLICCLMFDYPGKGVLASSRRIPHHVDVNMCGTGVKGCDFAHVCFSDTPPGGQGSMLPPVMYD